MMRTRILFFFILLSKLCSAQNLSLCTSYDSQGNCTGNFTSWQIQRNGNYMYIVYQSATPITDTLSMFLEKTFSRKDTAFYRYDYYHLVPDSSKKFAVNKYVFTKPGKYRITVYDRKTERLLKAYTTMISFKDEEYTDRFFTDTWYYRESEFAFCDSVVNGEITGKKDVFTQQPHITKATIFIRQSNKQPLKTDHLFARLYSLETQQLIRTYSYSINPDWYWTFVPLEIKEKGKYSVELYNDEEIFINRAPIEIK